MKTIKYLALLSLVIAAGFFAAPSCVVVESPYEPVYVECWDDFDCPYDMYCTTGDYCRYVGGCYSDGDCLPGYFCAMDGSCVQYNECSYDWECQESIGYGYVCHQGACTQTEGCYTDYDCPYGFYCDASGFCLETQVADCWYDSDCWSSCMDDFDCPGATSVCMPNGFCSNSNAYFCGADAMCHFGGDCQDDYECPYGQYCTPDSFCKEATCFEFGCDPGYMCATDGSCYAVVAEFDDCYSDHDCPNDFYCASDGNCYSLGCYSDMDCPNDYYCGYDGYCWPYITGCMDDYDCGANQVCLNGTCADVYICIDDNDCPWGAYCDSWGYCVAF